jgi:sugar/nucleoside kinase (ribokinase family)
MSLLVVGTVAFDAIETPFGKTEKIVGGAASYIALAASYFIREMHLVSVIGDDFPDEFLNKLKKAGVHLDGLQVKKGEKSFFWRGKYHTDLNMRDTLETQLNVLAGFDPVVPEAARNAEFLMLGNLAPSVQISVIRQMATRPKLIVLDTMNFWMDSAHAELMEVLKMVDVLTINDAEARQLSGEYSLVKAAQKILRMGPRILVVKKGEHGALLFNEKEVFFAPALPLEEVYDPTGAGDSFAGGFIGHLAKTRDISYENMKRAIIFGSALASFTVEKFGTDRLIGLSQSDVEERVQEFVDLVQFDMILL